MTSNKTHSPKYDLPQPRRVSGQSCGTKNALGKMEQSWFLKYDWEGSKMAKPEFYFII